MSYILSKSSRSDKKFMVILPDGNRSAGGRKVHFGAVGYSDYTKHKDDARQKRYIIRHQSREDWSRSGIDTAGFWSRWILWNKPSFVGSVRDTERKFRISIIVR